MVITEMEPPSFAQLVDNGTQVLMLQTALSKSESNATTIPRLIKQMDREGHWRQFAMPNECETVFEWNAADFRRFIESPRPAGCQTPLHLLERMLRGTDAWEIFLELTRGDPGAPIGNQNSAGQDQETNRDDITVCQPPRDYSREAPTGTSVSYALRRLRVNRPDLYELVKTGEMTANAAMVIAGFREQRVTVPIDPMKVAPCLARHFNLDQLRAIADAIRDLCDK